MRLRVDVATADVGDDAGGGRLGDISLTLTGPTALAGPFRLPTEGGARLRAGGVESWTVEGAADARPLRGADVSLAQPPVGAPPAAWRLAWVRVVDADTGDELAFFAADRWLRAGGDSVGLTTRALAAPPSTLVSPATASPGYRLVFHTSPFCVAGTRARVSFELVGDRGATGAVPLPGGAPHFRRGRADAFTLPLLPSVGALRALRVATDGGGPLRGGTSPGSTSPTPPPAPAPGSRATRSSIAPSGLRARWRLRALGGWRGAGRRAARRAAPLPAGTRPRANTAAGMRPRGRWRPPSRAARARRRRRTRGDGEEERGGGWVEVARDARRWTRATVREKDGALGAVRWGARKKGGAPPREN